VRLKKNPPNNGKKKRQQQNHFSCGQCGAKLTFLPNSNHLSCDHCGHLNTIQISTAPIHEYDFHSALKQLTRLKQEPTTIISTLNCSSCGAQFTLKDNEHAGDCPFCSAPTVIHTENTRYIYPESLLPFIISERQAQKVFDQWISSRWFAPSALKDKSRRDEKLAGVYLPYWTYDSQTETAYKGMRGIVYYERQVYTSIVNGRSVRRVKNIQRVHWTSVSGHVSQHFDDVLIGATKTLPRIIINNLHPWDLENLIPYTEAYLSGFRSEIYQVGLEQGFTQAQEKMEVAITQNIRHDIGGDRQRIAHKQTQHHHTTYKHLLLPVWSAAFKYHHKTYRFVINGRNGKIEGERPYSPVKIILVILVVVSFFLGIAYYMNNADMLTAMDSSMESYPFNEYF
jgi:DNA-directed RNA polymerase subunit RPC12/RpoP